MKHPKSPRNFGAGVRPILNSHKLISISLRLTKQQQEKLNLLGGTTWIRQQIEQAEVADPLATKSTAEKSNLTDNLGQCQCKGSRGDRCLRKANFVLKKVIDGQTYEFRVCQEHRMASQQGSLVVSITD